jgi:hypothetical protein
MQNFLKDCSTVFPVICQVVKTYSTSSEAGDLLILQDGVRERFTDGNQALHFFLK